MPDRHPSSNELLLLAVGLSRREARALAHALGCPECTRMLAGVLAASEEGPPDADGPGDGAFSLSPRLSDQLAAASAELRRELEEARSLLPDLLPRSVTAQRRRVAADVRYHSQPFVLALLDEAARASGKDPRRAERLARLAAFVCEQPSNPRFGAAQQADLRSQAFALLGRALARQGRMPAAEAAFRAGARFLTDLDSVETAGWTRLLGRTRRQEGRLPEAVALLERAAALCDQLGAFEEEATILAEIGEVYHAAGAPGRAVTQLSRAALVGGGIADPAADLGRQIVTALLQIGQRQLHWAEAFLAGAERLARDRRLELPVGHTLARAFLAARKGDRAEAEERLRAAWRDALGRRAWPEAALAAFHLAVVLIAEERTHDLARLASEMTALLPHGRLPEPVQQLFLPLTFAVAAGNVGLPDLLRLHAELRRHLLAAREEFFHLMVLAEEPGLGLVDLGTAHEAPDGAPAAPEEAPS